MQKSLIFISAICLLLACEEAEDSTSEATSPAGSSNSLTGNQSSGSPQNQSANPEEVNTSLEFKNAFGELLVNHIDQCCSLNNELKARYTILVSDNLRLLDQPVKEGWASFDAEQANICLNELASAQLDCNDLSISPFELARSCSSVIIGQQDEGMPCGFFIDGSYYYSDIACINGLKCTLSTPSVASCQPAILEGEACFSDSRCEQSLECINGNCARRARLPVSCADVISSF